MDQNTGQRDSCHCPRSVSICQSYTSVPFADRQLLQPLILSSRSGGLISLPPSSTPPVIPFVIIHLNDREEQLLLSNVIRNY